MGDKQMAKSIEWCVTHPDSLQAALDNASATSSANTTTLTLPHSNGVVTTTQPLTGIASTFWPNGSVLKVSFTNGNETQQARVMEVASRWSDHANIRFEQITDSNDPAPDIRVTFNGSGNWSQIGTNSRIEAKAGNASMNFSSFMPSNATILHEFGHALGLKHEHQNPKAGIQWNKPKVYEAFTGPPHNWTTDEVNRNIFDALKEDSLLYSRFDPQSIMGYTILPTWTTDEFSSSGGNDLSAFDISGIGDWYPFGGAQRPSFKPASDDIRVLTRDISGRMLERRWDGTRWQSGDKWSLTIGGEVTGQPGLPEWNSGSHMAVVSRSPTGAPIAAEFSGNHWRGWTNLGGEITGSPTVLATGSSEWCFVRGASGRPFFKRRNLHGTWNTIGGDWTALGGSITGGFSGHTYREKLALAVRGSSGQAAIKWWDGKAWRPGATAWVGLGDAITAQPSILWLGDNLHVVARFPDGTPHHLIYDTSTRRTTQPWTPIAGSILGSPTLVREGRDVAHLLVRGISQRTFRRIWRNGAWSGIWEDLGGQALDSPTGVVTSAIGSRPSQLHVFVTGTSRRGFRKVWDGSRWTPSGKDWETLGGHLDWGT